MPRNEIQQELPKNPGDNQQVFDFITRKLLAQGRPSMNADAGLTCAYRGAEGARCAAGWCIADEDYQEEWDSQQLTVTTNPFDTTTADTLTEVGRHLQGKGYDLAFLRKMQMVHDMAASYSDKRTLHIWRIRFTDVARDFKLDSQSMFDAFTEAIEAIEEEKEVLDATK